MSKIIFRPFWSYDVLKTEKWLSLMHKAGYALTRIDFPLRLFYFDTVDASDCFYRIVYAKNSNGQFSSAFIESGYEKVCNSRNFYVIKTTVENPQVSPTYNGFLDRNKKLKFVVGLILLAALCFGICLFIPIGFVIVLIIIAIATNNVTVEDAPPEQAMPSGIVVNIMAVLSGLSFLLSVLIMVWLVYTYFKLRETNKQLEKLCGDRLDLSFTIPKSGLMTKEEEKCLRKSKKMIVKTRIAWVYAPDKIEAWLEKMEIAGFRLYRMSRIGNRFFFIKGEPAKVKYYVDYQNKTDPGYFNLNMDSGWKLVFTSISRIQAISVWSHVYNDEIPLFYSDKESRLKHAKRFARTYSFCFFPVCVLYLFVVILNTGIYIQSREPLMLVNTIIYTLLIFEFGFFALRTILYYFRVKKLCH